MTDETALPHVVAVMITGKNEQRLPWARVAIKRFHEQDYPVTHRHLLIVQDLTGQPLFEPAAGQTELCPQPSADRVSLGGLRNQALDAIAEQFPQSWVMQWDDDDYSSRERMRLQVEATQDWHTELRALSAMTQQWATTLSRQLRFSLPHNICRSYRGEDMWGIFGTVLHCPAAHAPRYECVGKHEDSRFLKCFQRNAAMSLPDWHYLRIYNGLNTWDAAHIMGASRSKLTKGHWHRDALLRPILCDFCCKLAQSDVLTADELRQLLPT